MYLVRCLYQEMIKYTRDEQERSDLQEALRVMLNILSSLNDVMHSTQIVGYSVCRSQLDGELSSRLDPFH